MEEIQDNPISPRKSKRRKQIIIIGSVLALVLVTTGAYKYIDEKNKRDAAALASDDAVVHEALDFANASSLATLEDYDYWKASIFPIDAYDEIRENHKRAIVKMFMDNKYTTSGEYFLTKIENRAKNVFAFGNFTGRSDKERKDLAFLIEKSDYQSSAISIISHEGHMLFWKEYDNELPVINSFPKGSKIYMDKMELESSPLDGLIIKFKGRKEALLYDSKTKTFESFYQYTNNDIKAANEEERYIEEEETDSVEVPD